MHSDTFFFQSPLLIFDIHDYLLKVATITAHAHIFILDNKPNADTCVIRCHMRIQLNILWFLQTAETKLFSRCRRSGSVKTSQNDAACSLKQSTVHRLFFFFLQVRQHNLSMYTRQ